MKLAVIGTGYVGLSVAILLAQYNEVVAMDIKPEKVDSINHRRSPIIDKEIQVYLENKELHLMATTDYQKAIEGAEYVIISTQTNYDSQKNFFDTSSVEASIEQVLRYSPQSTIIIKSTIPVGYVSSVRKKY